MIIPFRNVEKYVGECLESVAGQSLRDFEVICVDDGSTDGSADVAAAMCAIDDRFRLVRQHNMGPGMARNVGLRHATRRYLAFVDGDDVVPRAAFAKLVGSLESTGSDLACGDAMRLIGGQLVRSWAHKEAFKVSRKRTHITRHPALIRDRMVWNKVFRRSFWDDLRLAFPDRMYEDQPVAMAAHVRAASVDVLREVVYHWRQRDEAESSITQRKLEPDNLRDRLLSVCDASRILRGGAPGLGAAFDTDTLEIDMHVVAEAVARHGDRLPSDIVELAVSYLDQVPLSGWLGLPFERRLLVHLLHRRELGPLAEVFAEVESGALQPLMRRTGRPRRRWVAEHSRMPDHLMPLSGDLSLASRLVRLDWREGMLRGEGRVSIGRFDAGAVGRVQLRTSLKERKSGARISLGSATAFPTWAETAWEDDSTALESGYDFAFTLDPATLAAHGSGHWELHMELRRPGLHLQGRIGGRRWAQPTTPVPVRQRGLWLVPVRTPRGSWGVKLFRRNSVVRECHVHGDELVVSGELAKLGDGEPVLRLIRRNDGEEVYFPVALDGHAFTARVAFAEIDDSKQEEACWDLVLDQGKVVRPVVETAARPEVEVKGRRYLVDRSEDGCLMIRETGVS
ncbi:glycosyltransferase family 2 protein [Nonomuraea sp. NPDC059194]|uniref:glycosyltransferase family 2 protein n=1 Tax=Nonomuraea sp. NPDC059194 TaxID=3346764 RepID=UPI0036C1E09D